MLKPARVGLLIVVVVILAAVLSALNLPFSGRDFISFWTGAQAVRAGHSPYDQSFQMAMQQANGWDTTIELFPFHPYVYPPWLALLIWPLAWLPYPSAFAVWLALNLVLGAVAVWLLMGLLRPRGGRTALPIAWLISFLYLPLLHGVVVGQTHLLLFFLAAVVIRSSTSHHDRAAGVALGLMSVKPQVGLALALLFGLYWLTQRRWQAIVSLIVTGLTCVAISFVIVPNWVADMLAASDRFTALTGLPLLPSGFRDYPTVYAATRVGLEQDPALLVAVILGVVGALSLIVPRIRHIVRQPVWVSVLICAGLCVITPYARVYELTLLLWPMMFLAFSPEVRWPPALKLIVVIAIWLLPVLLLTINTSGVWNVVAPIGMLWAVLLAESKSHATLAG